MKSRNLLAVILMVTLTMGMSQVVSAEADWLYKNMSFPEAFKAWQEWKNQLENQLAEELYKDIFNPNKSQKSNNMKKNYGVDLNDLRCDKKSVIE